MPRSSNFLNNRICLITDKTISGLATEDMALAALRAGATWLQYREKNETRRAIYKKALKLRQITAEFGALFIVNDFPDIAAAVDADGVHLGQDDLPLKEARKVMGKKIIGISTHSPDEAVKADKDGADYIGFGPVFKTITKDAGRPKGIKMLHEIKKIIGIPVIAIGGITPENLDSVFKAGADAIAAASAIFRGDISENIKSFIKISETYSGTLNHTS